MLCKYYWIVLYNVHVTAFCLGGPFFPGHGVVLNGKIKKMYRRDGMQSATVVNAQHVLLV